MIPSYPLNFLPIALAATLCIIAVAATLILFYGMHGNNVTQPVETKVVIMYQNLHSPPHGLEGAVEILNELNPDMIWYSRMITGFPPVPDENSIDKIAEKLGFDEEKAALFADWIKRTRYTLEDIRVEVESTSALYCPCVLVQNLRVDFNYDPLTFEPIPRDKLEAMALDYSKWGLPYNREQTQRFFRERIGLPKGAYYPDITNENYQEYLFRKILALKDVGLHRWNMG